MRLFLFLVGGTGSRVLRPLIMQFAAGVRPLDNNGKEIPLEVVPIIIDPHKAMKTLKEQIVYCVLISLSEGRYMVKT